MISLSRTKCYIRRIWLLSIFIMGSSFSGNAIAANDGIAVFIAVGGELNDQDDKCLTKELRGLDIERTVLTGKEFRDSLFPLFEPKYAPDTVEEFSTFLGKPGVKARIESIGIRYVVSVVGLHTKMHDDKGAFWCGFAMDFSGCYGLASIDETTKIATIVWDLNDIENSRVTNAESSGKNMIVGFLLPLPIMIANSEGQACKEMAQQLTTYLEGGELLNASPIGAWEEERQQEKGRKEEAAIPAKEPILAQVLEGCRDPMIPNSRCLSVVVSPDGKTIAAGSSVNKIWLFNMDRQDTPAIILEGGSSYFFFTGNNLIESMAFSPDGRRLIISGSVDHKQATVWDIESRKPLVILGKGAKPKQTTRLSRGFSSVAISPDGKLVATGSNLGKAEIWEIDSGDLLYALEAATAAEADLHPTATAFHPGGALLATFSNNLIRIWNLTDGKMLVSQQGANEIENSTRQDVLFSPDGKTLAAHHCTGITLWKIQDSPALDQPGNIHLDDKITIPLFVSNEAQNSQACEGQLAFSPDQKFLYAQISAPVGLVKINLDTYGVEGIYQWPDDPLLDLAITPDGEYIATPYGTGIKLWSL